MVELFAKDFNTREDLETEVSNTHGRTTNHKEDVITGTQEELRNLKLRHGQRVWGVPVIATDYVPKEKHTRLTRGEVKPSIINGLIKSKNAHKNKNGKRS